ncbi:MAG: hypothetical protein HKN46_10120 [Acidimicrobiia bacterium]|nr:hypothetical protein [Acidimicrobiia bacterium]
MSRYGRPLTVGDGFRIGFGIGFWIAVWSIGAWLVVGVLLGVGAALLGG